jgi:hypothetical protein
MTALGVIAILVTIAVFLAICVVRDLWPPEGDDE